jgi:hypothetical protein
MNKSFFTVALACLLSIGALTASAENVTPHAVASFDKASGVVSSNGSETLKILLQKPSNEMKLSEFLSTVATRGGMEFGYQQTIGDKTTFVSLSKALTTLKAESVDAANVASVSLGKFEKDNSFKFGYGDGKGNFNPVPVIVESDAGFHGGFEVDPFFRLDFSEDPFDGNIEVLVMGEPLPASTVTLLVALAAGAGLLLYSNRKRHAPRIEQA